MSAVSNPTLDPILNEFYCMYRKKFEEAPGTVIREKMKNIKFKKDYTQSGAYFVCDDIIKLHVKGGICLTGPSLSKKAVPGSSLLAGRSLSLIAPEIVLEGSEEQPVLLVGLDSVSIQATEIAKVKNVQIYLLKDSKLNLNFNSFSAFENLSVYSVVRETDRFNLEVQNDWKTRSDFEKDAEERKLNEPVKKKKKVNAD